MYFIFLRSFILTIAIFLFISCDDLVFDKSKRTTIEDNIYNKTKKSDFINNDGSINISLEKLGFFIKGAASNNNQLKQYLYSLSKDDKFEKGEKTCIILTYFDYTIYLYFDENDNLVRKKRYGS